MTSIHTNTGAVAALSTLRQIDSGLSTEQDHISSGLRVRTASDNAAYWSIATTMKSDAKAMSAVSDSIGLTGAILQTAYTGMETVHSSLVAFRDLAIQAAATPPPDNWDHSAAMPQTYDPAYAASQQGKIEMAAQQHLDQMRTAIENASFSGVNLLYNAHGQLPPASEITRSFVIGWQDGAVQTMDFQALDMMLLNDDVGRTMDQLALPPADKPDKAFFDAAFSMTLPSSDPMGLPGTGNFSLFNSTWISASGTGTSVIENPYFFREVEKAIRDWGPEGRNRMGSWDVVLTRLDGFIEEVADRMSRLGSMVKSVQSYDDFNEMRMDTVDKGVGRLVDNDMDESSARLKALQTQKQLGIQALSIANGQAENILKLFQ